MRSQKTSTKVSSMISSPPMTGSVSHPNGGSDFCVFFSFFWISAECEAQVETAFDTGVLNCNVTCSGSSMREQAAEEKSFQFSVQGLAARALKTKKTLLTTSEHRQKKKDPTVVLAPSLRSNCNFCWVLSKPVNPIVSNSPHLRSE